MTVTAMRIRELREKKGWSQRAMAERLDVYYPTYRKFEEGKAEPKIAQMKTLADIFDVTLDYLYGMVDEARFLIVAEKVLNEYLPAFKKLAEEDYDD